MRDLDEYLGSMIISGDLKLVKQIQVYLNWRKDLWWNSQKQID